MKFPASAVIRTTCIVAMFTLIGTAQESAFAQASASASATESASMTPAKQRAAKRAERKAARKARRAKKNAELQGIEKNGAQNGNGGTVTPQSVFNGQARSDAPASAARPASAP
jgi:hypothetical protein